MKTKLLVLAISSVLFPVSSVLADNNSIETTIEGSRNSADLSQTGSYNSMTINQIDQAGAPSADNHITVEQDNFNTATATQGGTVKAEAVILQDSWGSMSGSSMPTGNSATIVQVYGTSAYAAIDQHGNGNEAYILQSGSGSAHVTQTGTGNTVEIQQFGADTYATVTQSGFSGAGYQNHANIFQSTAPGVTSVTADVHQSGSGNTANISQEGLNSSVIASALIMQQGDGNTATINQEISTYGTDISAAIYQGGNRDTATINQTGESNNQTIYQSWQPN